MIYFSLNFMLIDKEKVKVYTDGACSFNGTAKAQGGIGVFWSLNHPL